MDWCKIVSVIVMLLTMATWCNAKRILLLCFAMKSHVNEIRMIGEELVRNGHEVYGVLPPSFPGLDKLIAQSTVKFLTYDMIVPDFYTAFEHTESSPDFMEKLIRMTFLEDISVYNVDPHYPILAFCTNPLSDKGLISKLEQLKFDLAIVDAFMEIRCMYILVYKLGIPYVSLTTQHEPWLQRNPALPSFVPFPLTTGDYFYTEKMTFWQRLYNTYTLVRWVAYPGVEYLADDLVKKYAPEKPFMSIDNLAQQSLFWLIDTDVVIDYARPYMPNMVEVGGLTTKPPKPLPKDLEEFVQGAEHGVIVASFGSLGANLPDYVNEKLMQVFSKAPQRVVWAFSHDVPKESPSNVKIMEWIPQNDLLGHNNTRLFITHCGANGQFEALYNAVPTIAMPLFGDQPYNAVRGEEKGIGIRMDILDFTVDSLLEAIEHVLKGDFQNKVNVLSEIYRGRPMTPVQRSVYWIEHVMTYGGQHYHSHALDMWWYEYLMLDILAFVLGIFTAMLVVLWCCIRALCCRTEGQKLKQS